jgi:hypothetical protein
MHDAGYMQYAKGINYTRYALPQLPLECLNYKSTAVLMFLTQDIFLSIYYLTFAVDISLGNAA